MSYQPSIESLPTELLSQNCKGIRTSSFALEIPRNKVRQKIQVCGTVTSFGGKMFSIWFRVDNQVESNIRDAQSVHVTEQTRYASMGPLLVGMPRKSYQGGFSSPASSKLVGLNEISESISREMASRLSLKVAFPVLASCCVPEATSASGDTSGLLQEAAMVVEEHTLGILQDVA